MANSQIEERMYQMISERCIEIANLFNSLIECTDATKADEIRKEILFRSELLGYLFKVSDGNLGDNKEPYSFMKHLEDNTNEK